MKLLLLFFSIVVIQISAYTQDEQWVVKSGENPKEALGDSVIYKYPQFTTGTVYFKDGSASEARLNLNIFNGEMQFIKPAGDTMALADEGLVKYISIQNDTFYYSKVFVQSVHANPIAKLGKIEMIKTFTNKEAAYGQSSPTSSITSASYYSDNSRVSKLTQAKEVVFYKKTYYFIGDKFGNYEPALKKNIFSMFNPRKTSIDTFIKDNKLQLDKEEDLLKLVDFIGEAQN